MSYRGHTPNQNKPAASDCTLYFAPRRQAKQVCYRPAALRRNDSNHSLPSLSPTVSPTVTNQPKPANTWLGQLPWIQPDSKGVICGTALPRTNWRPDEEGLICAAVTCSVKFSFIERRHHCRRCGDIFCSAHSSRTQFLLPSDGSEVSTPPTPIASPRTTPFPSSLDLVALGQANNQNSQQFLPNIITSAAVPCRVCDNCYFAASAAPSPLLTPPISNSTSPTSEFAVPHKSAARTRSRHNSSSSSFSRSRQGSASGSSSLGADSTPATSFDTLRSQKSRGLSPAASPRAVQVVQEEEIIPRLKPLTSTNSRSEENFAFQNWATF